MAYKMPHDIIRHLFYLSQKFIDIILPEVSLAFIIGLKQVCDRFGFGDSY
jgi:hypothetical protein